VRASPPGRGSGTPLPKEQRRGALAASEGASWRFRRNDLRPQVVRGAPGEVWLGETPPRPALAITSQLGGSSGADRQTRRRPNGHTVGACAPRTHQELMAAVWRRDDDVGEPTRGASVHWDEHI
jgi:hypothetical protein